MRRKFKVIYQHDREDCGAACLAMVLNHYGCRTTLDQAKSICANSRNGLSLFDLKQAATAAGLETRAVRMPLDALKHDEALPCVVHWKEKHFIVVYRVAGNRIFTADPALGKVSYSINEFASEWTHDAEGNGFALLMEPHGVPALPHGAAQAQPQRRSSIAPFLRPYAGRLAAIALILLACSAMQYLFPLLTQAVIDRGVARGDVGVLMMILAAQAALVLGGAALQFLQSRMALIAGTLIDIDITEALLKRLFKLRMRFFGRRQSGDLLQRINDVRRIGSFLSTQAVGTLFAATSVVVYSFAVVHYSALLFGLFCVVALGYLAWAAMFMRRRKILDYEHFNALTESQDEIIQDVQGMGEIKLNNCSSTRLRSWKALQSRLLKLGRASLKLSQAQQSGGILLFQLMDAVVIYLCAVWVIEGKLTLGGMMAVQMVIGALKSPVEQGVMLMQQVQDFRISTQRVASIQNAETEKKEGVEYLEPPATPQDICMKNVTFSYDTAQSGNEALKDVSITIAAGKTTAIVGRSGSGKTTLLKLLLGFYSPDKGEITVGGTPLEKLDIDRWRDCCGTVLQDGYIFNDTIAANIIMDDERPHDSEWLEKVCELAHFDFIEHLPQRLNTRIGADGAGLSTGQKQRVLLARAIYKKPQVILLDEATNSLDATNERIIHRNITSHFSGRTLIIAAHRLSTVQQADMIVVLDQGRVVETGTHSELVAAKGKYYELVRDQIELA